MGKQANASATYTALTHSNRAKRQLRQQKQRNVVMAVCLVFVLVLCLYLCLAVGEARERILARRQSDPRRDPPVVDPDSPNDPGKTPEDPKDPGVTDYDPAAWTVVAKTDADLHRGLLLQVDSAHLFDFSANVNLSNQMGDLPTEGTGYQTYNAYYTPKKLCAVALTSFQRMCDAFYGDTALKDLCVVSAWRTSKDQDILLASGYTSIPTGATEYHTGYCVGLRVYGRGPDNKYYTSDDERFYMFDTTKGASKKAYGAWLDDNAHLYGFVLQEGGAYYEQTYRYVGKVHAKFIHDNGFYFIDYLTALRTTAYDKPDSYLSATVDGVTWRSYYVPATGSTTNVPVPHGCTEYEISGDNVGGFIVTYQAG